MLMAPVLIVMITLMVASMSSLIVGGALAADVGDTLFRLPVLASWYALAFFPTLIHGLAYASRSEVSRWRSVAYAHVYVFYALLWVVAGWWAFGRMATGRTSWLKTERLEETPASEDVAAREPSRVHVPT
jgi:1,2-diacylglycerol 3-beta-glucosyltransferase